MKATEKSIQLIILTYLMFGLINLFQHHAFLVPLTYSELFIFAIVAISFIQNWKQLEKAHFLLLGFSILSIVIHPFFWEIFLSVNQQADLYNSIIFDILKIVQWIALALFFFILSYNREENVIKLEWLVPTLMALVCLFNPPLWYVSLVFIIAGLSALYTVKRRSLTGSYVMTILMGIGIIHFVNFFYWI